MQFWILIIVTFCRMRKVALRRNAIKNIGELRNINELKVPAKSCLQSRAVLLHVHFRCNSQQSK